MAPDIIWSLSPSGREEKKLLQILHSFTSQVIAERKEERKNEKKDKAPVETSAGDDMFMTSEYF